MEDTIVVSKVAGLHPFQPGDRWCAIGDSITHGGFYHRYIYLYYATRFPRMRFDLINCGVGGATAIWSLDRMNPDILVHRPTIATLMFGVNDIWMEHQRLSGPGDFLASMQKMIAQLQGAGCQVVVLTPPPYDATAKDKEPLDPNRDGLGRYVRELREDCKVHDVPLIDLNAVLLEKTAQIQSEASTASLFAPDRVHPLECGHFIMAYTILKAQGCPAQVSTVEIDAAGRELRLAGQCTVSELAFVDKAVRFTLLEEALPFPITEIPAGADALVPFMQELDREMLVVHGLPAGRYALQIDGRRIADYSASDLDAGINLAEQAQTPQSQQAQKVAELNTRRHWIEHEQLRFVAMMEYGAFKQHIAEGDLESAQRAVEQYLKQFSDPAVHEERAREMQKYLGLKTREKELREQTVALNEQMYSINHPQAHHYALVPE